MTRDPSDMRFAVTHEWVLVGQKRLTVGITEFGQHLLSDVTGVELPEPDDHHYEEHEEIGSIESLRTSMDFHAPVAGRITAINAELLSRPELINHDPYGEGWLVEMQPDSLEHIDDELMDIDEYESGLPDEDEDE